MIRYSNFAIDTDKYGYIVGEYNESTDKNGKIIIKLKNPSYYLSIESAIKDLRTRSRHEAASIDGTLDDLIRSIEKSDDLFRQQMEVLKID